MTPGQILHDTFFQEMQSDETHFLGDGRSLRTFEEVGEFQAMWERGAQAVLTAATVAIEPGKIAHDAFYGATAWPRTYEKCKKGWDAAAAQVMKG